MFSKKDDESALEFFATPQNKIVDWCHTLTEKNLHATSENLLSYMVNVAMLEEFAQISYTLMQEESQNTEKLDFVEKQLDAFQEIINKCRETVKQVNKQDRQKC